MNCDDARRLGDLEHLGSCPACRALIESRASFADLRSRLQADQPVGCDVDALIDAAYGAPAPGHLSLCAACRKKLDDFRALVARLDGWTCDSRSAFPASCIAADEDLSLAASGAAPVPPHVDACGPCARRLEERRDVVRALELLPSDTRAPLLRPRRIAFAPWAAAAALLVALLLVPRPAPPAFALTVPGLKRLADAVRSTDDREAMEAVLALREAGGPVAERYLIDALGRNPTADGPIADALASMRSTAAVPVLVERARAGAAAVLPALADMGDPQAIRPLIDALDEPDLFPIAARGLARMDEAHLRAELGLFAVGATPEEAAALARTPHALARDTALFIATCHSDHRESVLRAADLELLVLAAGEPVLEEHALPLLRRQHREAVAEAIRRALARERTAAAAARAAAGLGLCELTIDLITALRRGPAERGKVRRALAALGDPRGIRELLVEPDEALEDVPPEVVRRAAREALDDPRVVRALANLPEGDYGPLLMEALKRRTSRLDAIRGLARLRYAPSIPHLIALLDSRDRDDAHHALVMISGAALGPKRSDWTRWWMTRRV